MTKEDKQLLIQDLRARLDYGVKFLRESWNYEWDQEMSVVEVLEDIDKDGYINNTKVYTVEDIKPFLRPMSSMTEEERMYIDHRFGADINGDIDPTPSSIVELSDMVNFLTWLLKNHFDIYGLIEKGLALDATGLGIY